MKMILAVQGVLFSCTFISCCLKLIVSLLLIKVCNKIVVIDWKIALNSNVCFQSWFGLKWLFENVVWFYVIVKGGFNQAHCKNWCKLKWLFKRGFNQNDCLKRYPTKLTCLIVFLTKAIALKISQNLDDYKGRQ